MTIYTAFMYLPSKRGYSQYDFEHSDLEYLVSDSREEIVNFLADMLYWEFTQHKSHDDEIILIDGMDDAHWPATHEGMEDPPHVKEIQSIRTEARLKAADTWNAEKERRRKVEADRTAQILAVATANKEKADRAEYERLKAKFG